MKKKIFTIFAAAALILGMTGCTVEDNPSSADNSATEKEFIGLWYEDFEYADETEEGIPFSRVLLAVKVDEDHTGYIIAGVFDEIGDEPVEVYGGPEEAYFSWKLLEDGRVQLGDPDTGETYDLPHSLTRGDGNYGKNITNVAETKIKLSDKTVTMTNNDGTHTLAKANAEKEEAIKEELKQRIKSNVGLKLGGATSDNFNADNIR